MPEGLAESHPQSVVPAQDVSCESLGNDREGVSARPVMLNVGGSKHQVLWETLDRHPDTRLGRLRVCSTHDMLMQVCHGYSLADNEYYFDRNPHPFATILNFYRMGKLHLTEEMCVLAFSDELEFWGIDEMRLEPCCQHKFYHQKDQAQEEVHKDGENLKIKDEENFGNRLWKKSLWDLMENPSTSFAARVR